MTSAGRTDQHYSRFDVNSSMIVDKGIALQAAAGTAFAARFMQSEKIQATVILRVLLRPHERRTGKSGACGMQ